MESEDKASPGLMWAVLVGHSEEDAVRAAVSTKRRKRAVSRSAGRSSPSTWMEAAT